MRVIQTKNDTIRLIFNPKTDGLCLSDFLIVRDGEDNFLGQIVEIYDDKFNQEENVATIRLVYRILPDQQVVPYDNFTPSRECEIARIKLEEIEKCVNADKATVPFGISAKGDKVVNIALDFFNNNPVVFADKLDETNCAFENIAQKLKSHKKVVAIDYTGNLNIKNSKRIKAINDFKLPLDFYSLDYIWEKALGHTPLEVQTELEDTFIELKDFVNSTEDKYIPFPRFIKVIEQQYKATPAFGLKVLLNKLKRYWNDGLFSRSKKEFQAISKAIQKEDAVIVDLSNLKLEWHKDFLEFVIRQIKDTDAYLLLRFNENNSNPEIINDLYLKNPKLNIISSVSYGFAKLPYLMEHVKNYVLFKTLNPRRDFGFANAQIAALNSSSFVAFGEDTKDFMFVLKNYIFNEEDLKKPEDKKLYIDLNLELDELTSVELADGNFELKNIHIQPSAKSRLSEELTLNEVMPETENKDIVKEPAELQENDEDTAAEETSAEILEADNKDSLEAAEETIVDDDDTKEENSSNEEIPGIVSNKLDEAVADATGKTDIQTDAENDAKVAELIEASLKNDEEYIKEIKNEETSVDTSDAVSENESSVSEIPVAEEDLDYFINSEEEKDADVTEDDSDEVITSDMIENAALNEEINDKLANEIEAQAEAEELEDKILDDSGVKKTLLKDSSDAEISADDAIKEEITEEPVQEVIEQTTEEPDIEQDEEKIPQSDESEAEEISSEAEENVVEAVIEEEPVLAGEQPEISPVEPAYETKGEAESKNKQPKQNPNDAIIIVKEKPILQIDDFTEDEPEDGQIPVESKETDIDKEDDNKVDDEDGISLKELAQKSIEARFEEVIGETKKTGVSKNQLKINENVSIDLNKIKNSSDSTESILPIFNNDDADDEPYEYEFQEGMKVSHQKYGEGNILKVVKYSNRCLLQIEFEGSGKRLLDPKIAKIKPV